MSDDRAARIAANAEALYEALDELLSIADETEGVAGWHLNGEVARWDEFRAIGRARAVLKKIGPRKWLRERDA